MHERACAKLLLIAAAWSAAPSIVRAQAEGPAEDKLLIDTRPAVPVATPAQDPIAIPAGDVPQLRATLFDPASRPDQRDLAAQKLLSRPGAEALAAVRDALMDFSNPAIQISAARALADNPSADPALIDPLFALIDPNSRPPLIDAAARALSSYKSDPRVLTRLLGLARSSSDERIRVASIRAAGTFLEKSVAQAMMDLMDPTAQPAVVNDAAEAALAYMTGFRAEATEFDQWQQWWRANQGKNDLDFIADIARARATRYDLNQQQFTDLQNEVSGLLKSQFDSLRASPAQATDLLLRYLRSTQPPIRAIGARIAAAAAAQTGVTPVSVRDQLRQLIGDANASVRREAALALRDINDADAIGPLLVQLAQESDPTVRAAIAQALQPLRDPRAIPFLIKLLDDPQIATVQNAARALSDAELWVRVPADIKLGLSEQAAAKLMAAVKSRTKAQENTDLRRDLILAMVPLASRTQAGELKRLLDAPAEVPKVRQALLAAVGALKDSNYADAIADYLDDTSDWVTRRDAVRALGQVATSFEYGQRLGKLLDPKNEPQAEVQKAAWDVLVNLFNTATTLELDTWAQTLKEKSEHGRSVVVYTILRDRAHKTGNAVEERQRNQQLGDAASEAGDYAVAITAYRDSYASAVEQRNPGAEESVSESLLRALLRGGKFAEAVTFTQQQIRKDPKYGELVRELRLEAERLEKIPAMQESARELIDLALKMNPPPKPIEAERLAEINRKLQNRTKEQNRNPFLPDVPLSVRAE
ncbi:MAG: HEAT repeat domain-containing protein [Burkholderiales bacterium]|nr:HEAT repeat domain-containing protein [Phycisphaerae bacterium]